MARSRRFGGSLRAQEKSLLEEQKRLEELQQEQEKAVGRVEREVRSE